MAINRFLNLAFGSVLARFLKTKLRTGSIKAAKQYIVTVKALRLVTLGIFGLGVAASVLVTGLVCVIVGLIGLAPAPEQLPVVLIATGVVLAIVATIILLLVFSQERWLRVSRAYDVMDSALGPWPGMFPPNPLKRASTGPEA